MNKNKPSTWSFITNPWQFCPPSFSMESSAPAKPATPTAEWSGLAWTSNLPSLLHRPPGHEATATGNVSHPFSLNLLAVCPLLALSARNMSNSVFQELFIRSYWKVVIMTPVAAVDRSRSDPRPAWDAYRKDGEKHVREEVEQKKNSAS